MNTETTENIRGWIGYDAECEFCRRWARRAYNLLARRGWHLAPLQAEWMGAKLGLKAGEPLVEMKVITADGRIFGGAEAVIQLARSFWWAWPVVVAAWIPGVMPLLRVIYRCVARNRHCLAGQCEIRDPGHRAHHPTSSFYEFP